MKGAISPFFYASYSRPCDGLVSSRANWLDEFRYYAGTKKMESFHQNKNASS